MKHLTIQDLQRIAEHSDRERLADERLAEIEGAALKKVADAKAENARKIKELGRPEYLFADNAERKEAKRQRWWANRARERKEIETKRKARRLARLRQGRSEW